MSGRGSISRISPNRVHPKLLRPRATSSRKTAAVAWASPKAACAGLTSRPSSSTTRARPGVWPPGSSSTRRASAEVSMMGCSRGCFKPRPTR